MCQKVVIEMRYMSTNPYFRSVSFPFFLPVAFTVSLLTYLGSQLDKHKRHPYFPTTPNYKLLDHCWSLWDDIFCFCCSSSKTGRPCFLPNLHTFLCIFLFANDQSLPRQHSQSLAPASILRIQISYKGFLHAHIVFCNYLREATADR